MPFIVKFVIAVALLSPAILAAKCTDGTATCVHGQGDETSLLQAANSFMLGNKRVQSGGPDGPFRVQSATKKADAPPNGKEDHAASDDDKNHEASAEGSHPEMQQLKHVDDEPEQGQEADGPPNGKDHAASDDGDDDEAAKGSDHEGSKKEEANHHQHHQHGSASDQGSLIQAAKSFMLGNEHVQSATEEDPHPKGKDHAASDDGDKDEASAEGSHHKGPKQEAKQLEHVVHELEQGQQADGPPNGKDHAASDDGDDKDSAKESHHEEPKQEEKQLEHVVRELEQGQSDGPPKGKDHAASDDGDDKTSGKGSDHEGSKKEKHHHHHQQGPSSDDGSAQH